MVFVSINKSRTSFRVKISNISSKLRGKQFTSRKMDENHTFCVFKGFGSYHYDSKIYFQLLSLLCHGFGNGCFWIIISNLVRLPILSKHSFYLFITFELLLKLHRQPFDWKNLIGYSIIFIEQYIMLAYFCTFASAAISLEIGSYLWVMEFIKDIKNDISSISKIAKSRRNQTQMLKKLFDSIQFHSHVKQLSKIE